VCVCISVTNTCVNLITTSNGNKQNKKKQTKKKKLAKHPNK